VGLGNVLHTGLLGALKKVQDGLVGSEVARRAELADGCPAAVGTLTPASRRLSPSNKRKEVLLGTLVDLGAARACGEIRGGGVHRGGSMADGGGSEPVASRAVAAWLHL
jgi:hypothetical protein